MFQKKDYVLAVYHEQSFTKAAKKLYISQPCLSAAIKKIEEEIGMPLFERRYSSLRPTEIGQSYLDAAEKITLLEQNFATKLHDLHQMETGHLTIGGSGYISSYIFPRIVNRFIQLYPKIQISLVETNSVELEHLLQSESVDLVIDSFDGEKEGFDWHPLLEEKILLAVPAHRACNEGLEKFRTTPEELFCENSTSTQLPALPLHPFATEKFILLKSGNNMYRHANAVFQAANFTPDIAFSLDQLMTSYTLTASDNGVCFVTDTMFKFHRFRDDIFLYNLQHSGSRTMYILQKHNRYTTAAMQKFIQIAKEILA